MSTHVTLKQVQEIYIGLLGRAADLEGLNYWAGEINSGVITIEQVRANIVNEQPEYAANLGALTSRAILVAELYQNMFNRAPDAEGLEYWVNGDGKAVNADQLVLALSNGASAIDRLALDNRADVANFYTTNATFNVSSAAAVLATVTSSLSSVADAKASVTSGTSNGQTFTLTDSLAALTAANTAKADFAAAVDTNNDGTPNAFTSATVNAGLATEVTDTTNAIQAAGQVAGFVAAAPLVQAAMIVNNQNLLVAAKATDDAAVVTAQTAVGGVAGLTAAAATAKAATEADDAATEAVTLTTALETGSLATFNELNAGTVTIANDGTIANIIELDDGALKLANAVTEVTHPGVTNLLSAINAKLNAVAARVVSDAAKTSADAQVKHLDLSATGKTELIALSGAFEISTPAIAATPTLAEIATEKAALEAGLTTLTTAITAVTAATDGADDAADNVATKLKVTALLDAAVTGKFIATGDKTDIQAAFDTAFGSTNTNDLAAAITDANASAVANSNFAVFETAEGTFNTANDIDSTPLTDALTTAETAATAAATAITDFQTLVDNLEAAKALVAEVVVLDAAIAAAQQEFTDSDLLVPVTLADGANLATAAADIFLVGTADASITNFSLLGNDLIFIGDLTRVDIDAGADGNLAAKSLGDANTLEVFVRQENNDVALFIETVAFAGNQTLALVAGDTTDGIVKVTLTGVTVDQVVIDGGFVSIV